jgi:aerobic carbon-monoxide dehydrogenase large subunit
VVDIDPETCAIKIRRFVAIDDCGNIINPMIVQGQVHGGLTQGLAPAMYEELIYDKSGNILNGTFMDYLVPTAVESPSWETGHTVTPAPHHPIGAKGVGESPTVGAPPAIVNAIVDAVSHLGIKHLEIPVTSFKLYKALKKVGYFKD